MSTKSWHRYYAVEFSMIFQTSHLNGSSLTLELLVCNVYFNTVYAVVINRYDIMKIKEHTATLIQ